MARQIQSTVVPQPFLPPKGGQLVSQVGDVLLQAFGQTADTLNAVSRLQNQKTQEQLSLVKFNEAQKNATAELKSQGYALGAQENQRDIQQFDMQATADQMDLPGLIGKYKNNLRQLMVENPGLVRPVREKVQDIIVDHEANTDMIAFDGIVNAPENAGKDVKSLFDSYVSKNSQRFSDPYEKGQYLQSMQKALFTETARRTVQTYEKDRLNAIDAAHQNLRDNISGLLTMNALNPQVLDAFTQDYINSIKKIDNTHSDTSLKLNAFNAVRDVLLNDKTMNSDEALQRFDTLFPTGAKFGDNMSEALANALKTEIVARKQQDEAKLVGRANDAIKLEQNPMKRVDIKAGIEALPERQVSADTKAKISASVMDANATDLSKNLDNAVTREDINNTTARADALFKINGITKDAADSIRSKSIPLLDKLKYQSEVNDIVSGVKGASDIQVTEKHFEWIDKYVQQLMLPVVGPNGQVMKSGLSMSDAYNRSLSKFGLLTNDQIERLNNLGNAAPGETPDTQFEKAKEAASVFTTLDARSKNYMEGLISEGKIKNPKIELLATQAMYFGNKPEDMALYLSTVPNNVLQDGLKAFAEPDTKNGVQDSASAIRGAWTDQYYFGDWRGKGPTMVSPDVQRMYRSAYLYHYGILNQYGGVVKKDAQKTAAELAKKDIVANTFLATIGNDRVPVNPRIIQQNSGQELISAPNAAQFGLMNKVWDRTLQVLEHDYESVRYNTTSLDVEHMKLSPDSSNWMIPVYKTDIAGGVKRPLGYFNFPTDEVQQKSLTEGFNAVRPVSAGTGAAPSMESIKQYNAVLTNTVPMARKLFTPIGAKK
jgi:hypothetical protein